MKSVIVFSSFLATGSASTIGVINTSSNNNVIQSQSFNSDIEISDKNISELSSIAKLKSDNAIPPLQTEVINDVKNIETYLQTHHSSVIYANYSSEKSDVVVTTTLVDSKHKHLGSYYKDQIKLSKTNKVYGDVKSHLTTNAPTTSQREIKTENGSCKIKKKTSTAGTAVAGTVDGCSYGWNIITMSVEDKIKQLLEGETTTPSDISTRFNALTS